jgi:nucleoid-associated protein YgaU
LKRITLSLPRMESLATESAGRTDLVVTVLRVLAAGDLFLPDDVRATVDTLADESVVAARVSTTTFADCGVEAAATVVSAADCPERAQPAANTTAARASANESLVIVRIAE